MQPNDDDKRDPPADMTDAEGPLQALYPNLDKVSRSSFTKGTVSRSRINKSIIGLVGVAVIITGLIVASVQ